MFVLYMFICYRLLRKSTPPSISWIVVVSAAVSIREVSTVGDERDLP